MTIDQSSTQIRKNSEMGDKNKIYYSFATLNDLESLVALHFKCFTGKEHIIINFGRPFVLSSFRWFITSPNNFIVIAKQGNNLIGYQTVSEGPYNIPMLLAGWREAIRGLIFHPWLVFRPEIIRRLQTLLFQRQKTTPKNGRTGYLAFIGVDPNSRGKGVGKALVISAIRSCYERGMRAITTGVLRQNINSIAMLEKAGLVKVPEQTTSRYVHLELNLDQDDTFTDGF